MSTMEAVFLVMRLISKDTDERVSGMLIGDFEKVYQVLRKVIWCALRRKYFHKYILELSSGMLEYWVLASVRVSFGATSVSLVIIGLCQGSTLNLNLLTIIMGELTTEIQEYVLLIDVKKHD